MTEAGRSVSGLIDLGTVWMDEPGAAGDGTDAGPLAWAGAVDAALQGLGLAPPLVGTSVQWLRSARTWPATRTVRLLGGILHRGRHTVAVRLEVRDDGGELLATVDAELAATACRSDDGELARVAFDLRVGASIRELLRVTDEMITEHMTGGAGVLATPMVIAMMEATCADLLVPHLPGGHAAVGTRIDVRHIGAAFVGELVEVEAVYRHRRGRQLLFDAEARVGDRIVCVGQLGQSVVRADHYGTTAHDAAPIRWMQDQLTPVSAERRD